MGVTQIGIFSKAKLAKEKYTNAQAKEDETLANYSSKIDEYTINGAVRENANANNYSKNEQVIGTWINGKPLYRKVIHYVNTSEFTSIEHGISNLDVVTKFLYVMRKQDIYTSDFDSLVSKMYNFGFNINKKI